MIAYLLAGAFAIGLAVGGGGISWWHNTLEAKHAAELAEAQAKVDELVTQTQTQAAESVKKETAAYVAGEANAKVITKVIYERGQAYVASNPAFSNRECRVDLAGVQLLASARLGLDPSAPTPGTDPAVPRAAPHPAGQPGRQPVDGGLVPPSNTGRSSGISLPPAVVNPGGNGQAGTGSAGHLRPKPQRVE